VRALCHDVGVVLAQIAVQTPQQEAELTVAPALVQQLDGHGRVLTGAALSCQRTLGAQVVEAGGDDLVVVDDKQPTRPAAIHQLCAPALPPAPGHAAITIEEQRARTVEQGHGRLEIRAIRVSSELADYLDWPYAAHVFAVTRNWTRKRETKQEECYGITSLPQEVADAERVLALKRGPWGIENRLHDVKEVTLGEDQSTIQGEAGPHVMAILRNAVVSLLRRAGYHAIAARLRHNSRRPEDALALLGLWET
jgi:predicted transposase YbfD/YdcC